MSDLRDLFQWYHFISPKLVRPFFWVASFVAAIIVLTGLAGSAVLLGDYPLVAGVLFIASTTVACFLVMAARLVVEVVLISFRTSLDLSEMRALAPPASPKSVSRPLAADAPKTHRPRSPIPQAA